MDWFAMERQLNPHLRAGDLAICSEQITQAIRALPNSPFHLATQLHFTNDSLEVANHIDGFLFKARDSIDVHALYAEANGFDINPDLWFFSLFAFDSYGGHRDYDWLSDFQYEDVHGLTLTGMERLQVVYASDAYPDPQYEAAARLASLYVVVAFQSLIQRSARLATSLSCPLLATAHDYQFIYEFKPAA